MTSWLWITLSSWSTMYGSRAFSSFPKRKKFQHGWDCPTTSRWLLRLTTSYDPLLNMEVFSKLNQISRSHCFVLLSFSLICRKENRMLLPFPLPINSENDNVEKSLNDLILVLTLAIWREKIVRLILSSSEHFKLRLAPCVFWYKKLGFFVKLSKDKKIIFWIFWNESTVELGDYKELFGQPKIVS